VSHQKCNRFHKPKKDLKLCKNVWRENRSENHLTISDVLCLKQDMFIAQNYAQHHPISILFDNANAVNIQNHKIPSCPSFNHTIRLIVKDISNTIYINKNTHLLSHGN